MHVVAVVNMAQERPHLFHRRFIKGDAGMKKAIATRIAGSADLYQRNNRC